MNKTFNTSNSTYEYGVLENKTVINIVNKSVMFYTKNVIRDDIEKIQEINAGGVDDGTAVAISISSVFVFIGCLLSCGWYKLLPCQTIAAEQVGASFINNLGLLAK